MFFISNFCSFYIYIVIIMCFSVLDTFSAIHGRYTRDINEYELSIPHRVTSQGEFISFSIPQYFKHNFQDRHKRDTTSEEHKLYYNVIFDGKEHSVELWPNHGFISPNIVTEDYNHKLPVQERVLKRMDRNRLCHYSGRVKGHKQSSAALSVCHGLAGYLTTDSGHYYIEPMAEHGPNENGEHVHIVHKRRPHDKVDSFGYPVFSSPRCGMTEKWEDAWNRELLRKAREDLRRGGRDQKSQLHSLHRYIELLLVIDKKFIDYHKKTGIEPYIMTIMNMVSNYYHDQSVGNIIDVTVVRIIYLNKTNEHLDLSVSQSGEKTLDSLCTWGEKINPRDISNPMHHDIAVLFTRYDLCSNSASDCGLLGLAYLASACNPKKAGVINEDTGLALGTTVTHEVGHAMGCAHDEGTTATPCTAEIEDSKGNYYIMAPYSHLTTTRWSSCSRKYINSLFESGLGDCLNDEPKESLYHDENDMPPGAVYDADYQCGSYFANHIMCNAGVGKFCDRLYCKPNVGKAKSCRSNGYPPADGTKCAENKWCYARKCVEMGQMPDAVDGGWGEWGPWGECSRECGGGLQSMERDCTNPAPMNKGRYCMGERKRQKICNTQPCEANPQTFREKQCTAYNSKPFRSKLYTWKPYTVEDSLCELICINNDNAYVNLAPRVIDGTSCKPGSKDKCIAGVCRKVGCDNVIGSNAVEDVCGVCNGDGTNCKITKNTFTGSGSDYTKVAIIPAGVRHLRVTESTPSINTLAISTPDGSQYYLNGAHYEESNGDYDFGGVIGVYDHPTEKKETLYIPGPLKKPLALYEVFYSPVNPGLEYEYSESRPAGLKARPSYIWEFEEFEGCSARCGQGVKKAEPSCTEKSQGRVSDKFCDLAAKPEPKTMECFVRECKFKWRPTGWGACSGCKNKPGTKERAVDCVQESAQEGKDPTINEDKYCTDTKPSTQQMCCSDEPCSTKRSYNEADRRIADLWHQLDFIKTKHNLYEKEKEAMLAKTKNVEPEFAQIVRQLSDDEVNRQHLVRRYLGDLAKFPTKFESVAPSFQPLKRNSRFQKRENESDECLPTASAQNDTAAAPTNGTFIQDTVPPEGQEVVDVPIKLSAKDVHLSDQAFEQAGDSVADTLDFCNSKTYKGKEADEIIAEAKNNAETTAAPPTIKN